MTELWKYVKDASNCKCGHAPILVDRQPSTAIEFVKSERWNTKAFYRLTCSNPMCKLSSGRRGWFESIDRAKKQWELEVSSK